MINEAIFEQAVKAAHGEFWLADCPTVIRKTKRDSRKKRRRQFWNSYNVRGSEVLGKDNC